MYSNVTTSTRINILQCTYVHLRLFHSKLHSTLRVILQGFVTQNATWCQNRGCICISSVRRTYGRIHMLPVIQTSTIILWTELFPKKRREKIQGEILQSIFEYSGVSTFYKNYSVSTRNPASFQSSRAKKTILHTELILLHEISKKYYNYKAHPVQAPSSNCSPCLQAFYMAE